MEGDTSGKEADTVPEDHGYASPPDPAGVDLALDENLSLREEILQLGQEVERLTIKQRFGIQRFAGSHRDFHKVGYPASRLILEKDALKFIMSTDMFSF